MRHFLSLMLVGVAIVLSLVFASYIVLTTFSPQRELSLMMQHMAQVQTVSYDAGLSWVRPSDEQKVSSTLYASGHLGVSSTKLPQYAQAFRVVHLSEDPNYENLSGEIRKAEGVSYVRYDLPGPAVEGVTLDGQTWLTFDDEQRDQWGSVLPGLNPPLTPIVSGAWSVESLDFLRALVGISEVAYGEYDGLTQIIDGVNTRILDAQLDAGAMQTFLLNVVRAKEGREPSDQERVLAASQSQLLSGLRLRLWIGTDHLLYRLQGVGGLEQADGSRVSVDVRVDFSGYGNDVQIDIPVQTKGYGELLRSDLNSLPVSATVSLGADGRSGTIVSTMGATLPVTIVGTSTDSDGDGLDDILEAFYGTDRNNPDTDDDGMSDGDEVRQSLNPKGNGSLFGFGLDR